MARGGAEPWLVSTAGHSVTLLTAKAEGKLHAAGEGRSVQGSSDGAAEVSC